MSALLHGVRCPILVDSAAYSAATWQTTRRRGRRDNVAYTMVTLIVHCIWSTFTAQVLDKPRNQNAATLRATLVRHLCGCIPAYIATDSRLEHICETAQVLAAISFFLITQLQQTSVSVLRGSIMVRFHWHVEQGYSAYMPPDGISLHKEANVTHASCEVEVLELGL